MAVLIADSAGGAWEIGVEEIAGSTAYMLTPTTGDAPMLLLAIDAVTGSLFSFSIFLPAPGQPELQVAPANGAVPSLIRLTADSGNRYSLTIRNGAIATAQLLFDSPARGMLLPGLYAQLLDASAAMVQGALAKPAADAIFIQLAVKGAARPYLVLNLVGTPPAGATLDGISDLKDGEIQLDAYADTPQAAKTLSNAVRTYLMKTFNNGVFPDGTQIQFVDVTVDQDQPYEQGGTGYLYRTLLRLHAFYTEAS